MGPYIWNIKGLSEDDAKQIIINQTARMSDIIHVTRSNYGEDKIKWNEPKEDTMAQMKSQPNLDQLWKWGIHEDNLFRQRLAFMAIAESLLFTAVISLLKTDGSVKDAPHLIFVLEILGLLLTILMWFGQWALSRHIKVITVEIEKIEGASGTYRTVHDKFLKSDWLRGIETSLPPLIFLMAWLAFLYW